MYVKSLALSFLFVVGLFVSGSSWSVPMHRHCAIVPWSLSVSDTGAMVSQSGITVVNPQPNPKPLESIGVCPYETSDLTKIDLTLTFNNIANVIIVNGGFSIQILQNGAIVAGLISDETDFEFKNRSKTTVTFPGHIEEITANERDFDFSELTSINVGVNGTVGPTGITKAEWEFSGKHYYLAPVSSSLSLMFLGAVLFSLHRRTMG